MIATITIMILFYFLITVVSGFSIVQPTRSKSHQSLLSQTASDDNDDRALFQKALARAKEEQYNDFVKQKAPSWMRQLLNQQSQQQNLPFQCSECGKCCKTKGSVYMSPAEIQEAASFLQISNKMFIETYASHILSNDDDEISNTWIRLKEKTISGDNHETTSSSSACIFLQETIDDANSKNQKYACSIYAARPVQCRTYPFWPEIVASKYTWNQECRRADNDSTKSHGTATTTTLPIWTPEAGGCEGMKRIPTDIAVSNYKDDDNEVGVPVQKALQQLYEYQQVEKRFPMNAIEKEF